MSETLIGKRSSYDFFDPETYQVFVREGQKITPEIAEKLRRMGVDPSQVVEEFVEWMASGKKKQVTAWARIEEGQGEFLVNGKEAYEYFPSRRQVDETLRPFGIANLDPKRYDIQVKVDGSKPEYKRHRRAIAFAIAGTLVCRANSDKSLVEALQRQGYPHSCYDILS